MSIARRSVADEIPVSHRQQHEGIVVSLGSADIYLSRGVDGNTSAAEQWVVQRQEDDLVRPDSVHHP